MFSVVLTNLKYLISSFVVPTDQSISRLKEHKLCICLKKRFLINMISYLDEPYDSQNMPKYNERPVFLELEPSNSNAYNTFSRGTISPGLLRQLPSRDVGYATLRKRNIAPSTYDELEVKRVVELIQNDPEIKDMDLEDVEKMNEEKLRELHYSLSVKRDIKKKLDHNQKKKQKKLSRWKQMKYSWSMKWQHLKTSVHDFFLNLQLWNNSLRVIQGKFGSGTVAYFLYLRRLFGINMLFFTIIMIFLVMPQLFTKLPSATLKMHSSCENETYIKDSTTEFSNDLFKNINVSFNGKEIITGGDSFAFSYLYYGAYSSKILSVTGNADYDIPLAYLLTIGLALVFLLVLTAIILAKSFKQNYIEHSGVSGSFFANKIFCGWDFAIASKAAAALHSRSLLFELKEHLESLRPKPLLNNFNEKCAFLGQLILFNSLALAILCAIGYLMYFLLEKKSLQTDINFLQEMSLALTVSAITIVVPVIFAIMSKFESYGSHQTQLCMSMIRALLLIAVIMGMLFYFWLSPNHQKTTQNRIDSRCWENELGMEVYRLMIVDFLVWVVLYFLLVCFKKIMQNYNLNFLGTLEFNIPWHIWNLLYNQVLCWIGTYFSPLIPFVFIIKLFIMFYIKKMTVLYFCQPPSRVWRANRAETVFLGVTFLSLILSMVVVGYTVIEHDSSNICGPFKMLQKPYDIILCIMDTFSKERQSLGPVVVFITKPGCVAFMIVILCCLAYYARSVSKARYKMVKLLRKQLITEGKDKVFLLQMFETAMKNLDDPFSINEQNFKNRQQYHETEDQRGNFQGYKSNYPVENDKNRLSGFTYPHSTSTCSEESQSTNDITNEYSRNSRLFDSSIEQPHSSHENIVLQTRMIPSPKKGTENIAFCEDSPMKNKLSPFANPLYSHQSPFQNLRKK